MADTVCGFSCDSSPGYPGIQDGRLVRFASNLLSGQMCGADALGLASEYSVPLAMLSEAVGYPGLDDGMVATSSCNIPGVRYGASPSDKYHR